jgi:hypothetical protein
MRRDAQHIWQASKWPWGQPSTVNRILGVIAGETMGCAIPLDAESPRKDPSTPGVGAGPAPGEAAQGPDDDASGFSVERNDRREASMQ